jgi:hypothetical protein
MPKKIVYTCDICETPILGKNWWEWPAGGKFTVLSDGINGTKHYWEALCYECRRALVNAVSEIIEKRKNG